MDAFLVVGDEIELTPDPPWAWMVPPMDGVHPITTAGKSMTLKADIVLAGLKPRQRLFIAGHTDTRGEAKALSEERAAVALAILKGDRAGFATLCNKRHTVADYKQILSWVTAAFPAFGFSCDPGRLDNNAASGKAAVLAFQQQYNVERENIVGPGAAAIKEDGLMGEETWGAIFDLYQLGIREELGEADAAAVAKLREGLVFLTPEQPAFGFGELHPIEQAHRNQFKSQTNRRVELLFFSEDDLPDVEFLKSDPDITEIYAAGEWERVALPPRRGGAYRHPLYAVRLLGVDGRAMASGSVSCIVRHQDKLVYEGPVDDGWVEVRLPPDGPSELHISWHEGKDAHYGRWISLESSQSAGARSEPVIRARLAALGYVAEPGDSQQLQMAALSYQRDYGLGDEPDKGEIPNSVVDHLIQVFEHAFEAVRPAAKAKGGPAEEDEQIPVSAAGCRDGEAGLIEEEPLLDPGTALTTREIL